MLSFNGSDIKSWKCAFLDKLRESEGLHGRLGPSEDSCDLSNSDATGLTGAPCHDGIFFDHIYHSDINSTTAPLLMPDGENGNVWAWLSSIARLAEILPIQKHKKESKQSKQSQSVKTTLEESHTTTDNVC